MITVAEDCSAALAKTVNFFSVDGFWTREKKGKDAFSVYLLWHEHLPGVLREVFAAFKV